MQESVSKDREKFIGGSDIPIIMELSPFKSRFDLLLEKAGYKKSDFKGNVFTEYGNTMESKIRDYINGEGNGFFEGKHIMDVPKDWNEHPNGMRIRCHTDGEDINSILEIKTASQIFDSLDDYQIYLVQILFYMVMTGKETGLLAVYKSRGADDVRIVDVCRAVADYHCRDFRSVSRAEDSPEVARLLDRLGDDDERILGELQVCELYRDMRAHHEKPVRALLVGDLREARLGAGVDLCAEPRTLVHQPRFVLVLQVELGAVENRARAIAAVERATALAVALDNHLARLLTRRAAAKLHDVLELGI